MIKIYKTMIKIREAMIRIQKWNKLTTNKKKHLVMWINMQNNFDLI